MTATSKQGESFMETGRDTIDYMQFMIEQLQLIANKPKNFNSEVATELEHISQDMYKSSKKLEELIYMYGDV